MTQFEKALERYLQYELNEIPDEPVTVSATFHKKMERMIRQARFGRRNNHKLRYALVAALVALIVFATTVAAVPQFREGFIHFVQKVFPKYTEIRADTETGITVENTREQTYTMNRIPTDFILVDHIETPSCTLVVFQGSDGQSLNIEQYPVSSFVSAIDTEDIQSETVEINGAEAILAEKDGITIVVWSLNEYVFQMTGNISKEDMIRTAGSIKINE